MDIYCKKGWQRISNYLQLRIRWNRYPGTPQMELLHIDGEPFRVKGIEVVPIRLYHHKLPVYGFRFGKFAYLTISTGLRARSW